MTKERATLVWRVVAERRVFIAMGEPPARQVLKNASV
jgi:hypothetical protein